MRIRVLNGGDLEQLSRLYEQFWGEVSSIDLMQRTFTRIQASPDYHILVAEVEGDIAGSIYGVICHELYGSCKPFLVIENFIVDRSARHQGIGKKLLEEMEKFAQERECSQIIFITESDRTDTIRFYKSAGYNPNTHTGFKKSIALIQQPTQDTE